MFKCTILIALALFRLEVAGEIITVRCQETHCEIERIFSRSAGGYLLLMNEFTVYHVVDNARISPTAVIFLECQIISKKPCPFSLIIIQD